MIVPFPNVILGDADVNGFALRVSDTALRETLPFLTYLSVFSWEVDRTGGIKPINDEQQRTAARAANVASLLTVTNLEPGGGFSGDVAHAILTNEAVQNTFMTN